MIYETGTISLQKEKQPFLLTINNNYSATRAIPLYLTKTCIPLDQIAKTGQPRKVTVEENLYTTGKTVCFETMAGEQPGCKGCTWNNKNCPVIAT